MRKGSFTAVTSSFFDSRAARRVNRPIRPNLPHNLQLDEPTCRHTSVKVLPVYSDFRHLVNRCFFRFCLTNCTSWTMTITRNTSWLFIACSRASHLTAFCSFLARANHSLSDKRVIDIIMGAWSIFVDASRVCTLLLFLYCSLTVNIYTVSCLCLLLSEYN